MQKTSHSLTELETVYGRHINFARAINVLAYELFKALLINCGGEITWADLDNGNQTEEQLWKSFIELYNQKETAIAVMELDDLKYKFHWNGNEPDPSQFTPIDWKKAQNFYKEIAKKYDMAHKK